MARPADLSSRPKISLPVSTTWSVSTARDTIHAARVVLALPLRLAAWLSVPVADVPSWLAGQAKLVAAYPAPFWRAEVLNGDAISHRGPLAEI
ncbi:MAG TPA: amine oxidase, partial [Salibaculum sp.]|nr:amine oxidase [Salibaculum sp.]